MRIRYCPTCGKAGLKWDDPSGKGFDGLTEHERFAQPMPDHDTLAKFYRMRYCRNCKEWVEANIGANLDQHKR